MFLLSCLNLDFVSRSCAWFVDHSMPHATCIDFFVTLLMYLKIENLPIPGCMKYVKGKLPPPLLRKSSLESGAQWTHLNNLSSLYSFKQVQFLYEWLNVYYKWLLQTGVLSSSLNSPVFDSCYVWYSFARRWSCLIFTKEQHALFFCPTRLILHNQRSASSLFLVNNQNGNMHLSLSFFPSVLPCHWNCCFSEVFLSHSSLNISGFMLGEGGKATKPIVTSNVTPFQRITLRSYFILSRKCLP